MDIGFIGGIFPLAKHFISLKFGGGKTTAEEIALERANLATKLAQPTGDKFVDRINSLVRPAMHVTAIFIIISVHFWGLDLHPLVFQCVLMSYSFVLVDRSIIKGKEGYNYVKEFVNNKKKRA